MRIGAWLVVISAAALAIVPVPAPVVEHWYSRGFYPPLQSMLTGASNQVPVALLDLAAAALLVVAVVVLYRAAGWHARLRWLVSRLVLVTAIIYLLFLAVWGLNYRRLPLEDKVDFDKSRITREALMRLANDAVARTNARYEAAHTQPLDVPSLERAFNDAVVALGAPRPTTIGLPKRSVLSAFFRRAAVDGMTDPWFLEIILNPDLLPVERPIVLAHEWAHLAGYAHESEANFVAWLACLRGDGLAQYSASLATYEHAIAALPREDRRLVRPLDAGPRQDLRAVAERYRRASPFVREASRDLYDSYLKANRVEEGVAAYGAVVRLMLGTAYASDGVPRVRPR